MMINEHQPQWDAETLMEAERIESDPNRKQAAQNAAKEMAKNKQDEANKMKKVAGNKAKGSKVDNSKGFQSGGFVRGSDSIGIPANGIANVPFNNITK